MVGTTGHERVLLQTEQQADVMFMVLTAVYTQRARGLSTVVAIWLGTCPITYTAAVSGQQRLDSFCHFDMVLDISNAGMVARSSAETCRVPLAGDVAPERRRVTAHLRARSASLSGGPRGFFQVRRASGCACTAARLFWGRRGVRREGGQSMRTPGGRFGARALLLPRRARCCAVTRDACAWPGAARGALGSRSSCLSSRAVLQHVFAAVREGTAGELGA
jgi:hypothetical protein